MKETPHYKNIINRLSRAEGQVRALREALENNGITDCKQFVTQIKAARSALRSANEQFVIDHIKDCQKLQPNERDERIAEALRIISTD
jgi:DNA-binding FrmR family transcriptional regulator